ncbi:unnamed protein product [Protopolystoma xenopodis]|uniref:Uncharacterized protein n=1 Tax=Protopolystoma xenopodis TaxID=117903 RepID=A0A448XKT5_9PLAT|nr:unnamed protein product [Protopolystoma xenopodis]
MLLRTDVDVQVGLAEAKLHLDRLIESRRLLSEQLESAEHRCEELSASGQETCLLVGTVDRLRHEVQDQTCRIADLQQKLLDASDSCNPGAKLSLGDSSLVDATFNSRLQQLNAISDLRFAIKFLFKELVSAKVSAVKLEADLIDKDSQISNLKDDHHALNSKVLFTL